ncbi:MAG TPA: hypothetical protein VGJ84_05860 [Polyangiaceae bacterium]
MHRRAFAKTFLGGGLSLVFANNSVAVTPASDELEQHELFLNGDTRLARRALLLIPKHALPREPLPLLILLHGLGETDSELHGIHAWEDRYGLVQAYQRLRRAPIIRTLPEAGYLTDQHLEELNCSLRRQPFQGMMLACPVTPNPHRPGPAAKTLDRYAEWIESALIPAVKRRRAVREGPRGRGSYGLDGCSMGGYVALEVFLRKPELFCTLGGVQAAISVPSARDYAGRIASAIRRVGPRPIQIVTSSGDPYRRSNQALSTKLRQLGVPNAFSAPPGPHNQPWLREIGTLEMLLWHDRQFVELAGR